ncbi:unnamed protein product, partial [marine sediment metagenome]
VWKALTTEEKEAWRGVCPGLTPYQCFMSAELLKAPPLPPFDIGAEALVRTDSLTAAYTLVAKENPASASGKIHTIEIWARLPLEACEVATFFVVSGSNLSTRDTALIGDVPAGSKKTFTVDLDVRVGDYIGVHCISGTIAVDTSGGAGIWHWNADYIPCTNKFFNQIAGYVMSLYGIGVET